MGNSESTLSPAYEIPNRNYNLMCVYDLRHEEMRVVKWNKRSQLFFPPDPNYDKIPQQQFLAPSIKLIYNPMTSVSDEYKSFIINASDRCVYPVPTDLCVEIEMHKLKFLLRIVVLGKLVEDGKLNIISKPILPPPDLSNKYKYHVNGIYISWKKHYIVCDSDELTVKWKEFVELLTKETQIQNIKLFEFVCPDIFINGKWPYLPKQQLVDMTNQEPEIPRKLSLNDTDYQPQPKPENQTVDPE
jgi:hypothetical protein